MNKIFYFLALVTSWVMIANFSIAEGGRSDIPSGAIIAYAGTTCPTGWANTDGSTLSRTTAARLFAAIGTAHGSGDGSTTFNLPDYRGRFLRGVNGAGTVDPDAASRTAMNTGGNTGNAVGSIQTDAFQGHFHSASSVTGSIGWSDATGGLSVFNNTTGVFTGSGNVNTITRGTLSGSQGTIYQSVQMSFTPTITAAATDGSHGTPRTSNESRPANAYVTYCIKL